MRAAVLLTAGLTIATNASAETVRAETCRKGTDVRHIEVVSPGSVGIACDVVYYRDAGSDAAVLYNANVDKDFCRARAAELAATLISEGFDCSTEASRSVEASLAGGEGADVDGLDAPLNIQLEKAAGAAAEDPLADEEPLIAEAAAAEPDTQPFAETVPQPAAAGHERKVEPSARPTPAEPVQLAADAQPSAYRAPRPPKTTGAGRLVGAKPMIDDIIDSSVEPESDTDPAKATVVSERDRLPARQADDVIRGVLAANAAAWNEGNLDSFMNGYANTAELLMVKDGVVTTGWREVRKAYEAEIAARSQMGRLSFEVEEVSLASSDAATVIGRYALDAGEVKREGVMTLVMKHVDGRWRIIQDTRVASAAANP